MKVIISQGVKLVGDNFPHSWRKEYVSAIIPRVGDYIEDPVWKDPNEYKVTSVTINYYADECYVEVEAFNIDIPDDRKEEIARMAECHGWKSSWNMYR